jgi:hypothetical protein
MIRMRELLKPKRTPVGATPGASRSQRRREAKALAKASKATTRHGMELARRDMALAREWRAA